MVTLDPEKHTYRFQSLFMPASTSASTVAISESKSVVGDPTLGGGTSSSSSETLPLVQAGGKFGVPSVAQIDAKDLPLGASLYDVQGSQRIPLNKDGLTLIASWHIVMEPPPVELIVTSLDYQRWRPSALPGPKAGTPLEFKAWLQSPDGSSPPVTVKSFRWQLVETSREPGIAMNFPLDAEGDTTPDLRFDPIEGQKSSDPELQSVEQQKPSGFTTRARVLPFDWGAWSTIKVQAVLDDGRTIEGKYQGRDDPIRLPHREAKSYIADSWKQNNKCTDKADDVDDEDSPVGNKEKGDGFSLYEEYRGWIVAGEHEEGSPTVKDFFVRNRIGKTAQKGIDLFGAITGLRVHSKLRSSEMKLSEDLNTPGPKDRIMNGNRSPKTPHKRNKDQHGVVLIKGPHNGASEAVMTSNSTVFRPIDTLYVIIESAVFDGGGILFIEDGSGLFLARDELSSTIAHELGHSVGIHHHGESDPGNVQWSKLKDAAGNPVGFVETNRAGVRTPIEIFLEQGMVPESLLLPPERRFVWVGDQHQQHSGDVHCVMRYDAASAYVAPGNPGRRVYFGTPPEVPGEVLCTKPDGTEVNDKDRKPVPRYGNAEKGLCIEQIGLLPVGS